VALAILILVMGVASPVFTRRMAASTDNVLRQMERVQNVEKSAPAADATNAVATARPVRP